RRVQVRDEAGAAPYPGPVASRLATGRSGRALPCGARRDPQRRDAMNSSAPYPKRLIEVDLPIKRISAHARREKSIRHGHISTLHIWWARRPLAACRAVICAALWPDPADPICPESFRETARTLMQGWADSHK